MIVEEWLNNNELAITIWKNKYRYNNESLDTWFNRVSGGNDKIKQLIIDKKFLFGGRTLANRGTNKGSFSNCYCSGRVNDSLEDIMQTSVDLAMTFKAQGGQGLSLTNIRPKGSKIGENFESEGIIPFMEIFNTITASISQGGCISKGQKVLTSDGWINIENLKLGQNVRTKIGYSPIIYIWNKGIQDIYKITSSLGYSITTTSSHKFSTNGFNHVPLNTLNVGDIINIHTNSNETLSTCLDPFYYLVGSLTANGYISSRQNSGTITFGKNDLGGKTIIKSFLESLGFKVRISDHSTYYRVHLSKSIVLWLYDKNVYKYKTLYTKLPEFVFTASKNQQASLIAGYIDANGSVNNNSFKICSISETVIDQLIILLNGLGFFSSKTFELRTGNRHTRYSLNTSIYKKSLKIPSLKINKFCKDFCENSRKSTPYTINSLKINKRTGHLNKISKSSNIGLYTYYKECNHFDALILDTIKSIEYLGKSETFDIELKEEHLFNCQGFYVSNSRKGALMMSIDIEHPQAEDFITIKSDHNKINNANLSVEIGDKFMKAVEEYYTTGKEISYTVENTFKGGNSKGYKIVPIHLYKRVIHQAWENAEPGVMFMNKFQNYNLMEYIPEYQIYTSNPLVDRAA